MVAGLGLLAADRAREGSRNRERKRWADLRGWQFDEEDERLPHQWSSGAIGYFDFSGNADMCIAIRTVLFSDGVATVRSGAGVVDGSDPAEEVRETQAKARALLDAIVVTSDPRDFERLSSHFPGVSVLAV